MLQLPYAAIAGLFLILPVHAGQEPIPEPAQLYRVIDVAADDVLNIRVQPDPSAEIVGTLAPDAQNVVIAGTRMNVGNSVWWQVLAPEGPGWVNARFLETTGSEPDHRATFPLQCVGTEPFWSVNVTGDEAIFETPMDSQTWQAGSMSFATGLFGRFAVALEDAGERGHIAAWRNQRFCSDGMSDIGFPFEGIMIAPDGTVYGGCCRRSGE